MSSYHCYLGEEADPHHTTTSFQVIVERDKVSPEHPLLWTKQSNFPQSLPVRLVFAKLWTDYIHSIFLIL